MNDYLLRKATVEDIPFLAEAVISAEKGNSDKLSYSTFFNLSEEQVKDYIIKMFEEEIDGCEFSVSSYLVYEYNSEPVATLGGWIECFASNSPSKILKSNLILHTFSKESIEFLKTNSDIIKNIQAEREPMTLQIEYCHVSENHRGQHLMLGLMKQHEENALSVFPSLKKIQTQVFSNNYPSLKACEKLNFKITKSHKSDSKEILNYLPSDEKYILEKDLQ
jgi:hypothetical protein